VVPGIILCEIMAQSACVALQKELEGNVPFFTGIDGVRFKSKVAPGDTFRTEVTVTKKRHPFYFMNVKGFASDTLCVSGSFSCAAIPKETAAAAGKK
jgi:3-hydroxyacyl-[acyl-carrier-protein] dehydratase